MRNSTLYVAIIVIGIIALAVGVLYQVQALGLGYHPTRAIAAIVAGVILIIIGIAGMMVTRNRGQG